MIEDLEKRLAELKQELDDSPESAHPELHDRLEQVVQGMAALGVTAPAWARDRLHDMVDEEVEDQFDNMPI